MTGDTNGKNTARVTIRGGEQEPDRRVPLDQATILPKLHPPLRVDITVYKRGKRWDSCNSEVKSVIDALVQAGVCEDDRVEILPEVLRRGVVVKTVEEERTVVEVYEIG
jgi:hypothetical protein